MDLPKIEIDDAKGGGSKARSDAAAKESGARSEKMRESAAEARKETIEWLQSLGASKIVAEFLIK
jgi:hypothetical protein